MCPQETLGQKPSVRQAARAAYLSDEGELYNNNLSRNGWNTIRMLSNAYQNRHHTVAESDLVGDLAYDFVTKGVDPRDSHRWQAALISSLKHLGEPKRVTHPWTQHDVLAPRQQQERRCDRGAELLAELREQTRRGNMIVVAGSDAETRGLANESPLLREDAHIPNSVADAVLSPIYALVKPGKVRIITDASMRLHGAISKGAHNAKIPPPPGFRLPSTADMRRWVKKGHAVGVADVENAFFSCLPAAPDALHLMCFRIPGTTDGIGAWTSSFFGSTASPAAMAVMGRTLEQATWQLMTLSFDQRSQVHPDLGLDETLDALLDEARHDNMLAIFVDDQAVGASSVAAASATQALLLATWRLGGVPMKTSKLATPSSQFTWLGFKYDTQAMTIAVPADKAGTIAAALRRMTARSHCTLSELRTLHGRLTWATEVCPHGARFLAALRRMLRAAERSDNSLVAWSHDGRFEALVWLHACDTGMVATKVAIKPNTSVGKGASRDDVYASDASGSYGLAFSNLATGESDVITYNGKPWHGINSVCQLVDGCGLAAALQAAGGRDAVQQWRIGSDALATVWASWPRRQPARTHTRCSTSLMIAAELLPALGIAGLETLAAAVGIARYATRHAGGAMPLRVDNTVAVAALNGGASRDTAVATAARGAAVLCFQTSPDVGSHVNAQSSYITTDDNKVADAASRGGWTLDMRSKRHIHPAVAWAILAMGTSTDTKASEVTEWANSAVLGIERNPMRRSEGSSRAATTVPAEAAQIRRPMTWR